MAQYTHQRGSQKEERKGENVYSEKKMTEIFPNLGNETGIQIQEAQRDRNQESLSLPFDKKVMMSASRGISSLDVKGFYIIKKDWDVYSMY